MLVTPPIPLPRIRPTLSGSWFSTSQAPASSRASLAEARPICPKRSVRAATFLSIKLSASKSAHSAAILTSKFSDRTTLWGRRRSHPPAASSRTSCARPRWGRPPRSRLCKPPGACPPFRPLAKIRSVELRILASEPGLDSGRRSNAPPHPPVRSSPEARPIGRTRTHRHRLQKVRHQPFVTFLVTFCRRSPVRVGSKRAGARRSRGGRGHDRERRAAEFGGACQEVAGAVARERPFA